MAPQNSLLSSYNLLHKEIQGYNRSEWEEQAKKECYKGIEEKFKQNEKLRRYLISMENKTIVESCYDTVWGTGCPLRGEECLNPRRWRGQGILGEMLEAVRENLRGNPGPAPIENEVESHENVSEEM